MQSPKSNAFVKLLDFSEDSDIKEVLESTYNISKMQSDGCKLFLKNSSPAKAQIGEKVRYEQNCYLAEIPAILANRFYCKPQNLQTLTLLQLLRSSPLLVNVPIENLAFTSQLPCAFISLKSHEKRVWRGEDLNPRIGFLISGSVLVSVTYKGLGETEQNKGSKGTETEQTQPYQELIVAAANSQERMPEPTHKIKYVVSAPGSFFGYSDQDYPNCEVLCLTQNSEWCEFFVSDLERSCPVVIRNAKRVEESRKSRYLDRQNRLKWLDSDLIGARSETDRNTIKTELTNFHSFQEVKLSEQQTKKLLERGGHAGIVSLEEQFATVKDKSPEMSQFYEFITPSVVSSKPEVSVDKPVTLGWGQEFDPTYFGNYEESYRIIPSVCSRVPPITVKNTNIGKEAKAGYLYNVNLCLPRYIDGKKNCWLPKYLPLQPHKDYLRERNTSEKSRHQSQLKSASRFLEESTFIDLDPVVESKLLSSIASASETFTDREVPRTDLKQLIKVSKLNFNQNVLKIRGGTNIKKVVTSKTNIDTDPEFETAREQARKNLKKFGHLHAVEESVGNVKIPSTIASEHDSPPTPVISQRSPWGSNIFGSESIHKSILSPVRVTKLTTKKLSRSHDQSELQSFSINSDAYHSLSLSREEMSNRLMEVKKLSKSRIQELPFMHAHTKGNSKSRMMLRESRLALQTRGPCLPVLTQSPTPT